MKFLENRLIFDLARKKEEKFLHAVCDLESCYDSKLPKIGGTLEESIGANRQSIKLVTKVLPRHKNCNGTAHGKSVDFHGGPSEVLGGTGQGNIFSGFL